MSTSKLWKTGGFPFLSISAILMPLFHRLNALQVGIIPCTQEHIQRLDVHFRKFCPSIGPPPHIVWTLEWHEVLHPWKEPAAHVVGIAKMENWSRTSFGANWKLAAHGPFCLLSEPLKQDYFYTGWPPDAPMARF